MDEDGTARFAEGHDFRGCDDAVLEFRSGGRGGNDVVGFRHANDYKTGRLKWRKSAANIPPYRGSLEEPCGGQPISRLGAEEQELFIAFSEFLR